MTNQLKNNTRLSLETASYNPKRLALQYSAITLGGSLLAVVLSWLTELLAQDSGGLSGMDTRALWDTVSVVLTLAMQIIAPLLTLGFLHCCILLARGHTVRPGLMTVGLRRWGVILWLSLLQGLFYLALLYLTMQAASILYVLFPGSAQSMESVLVLLQDPAVLAGNISQAQLTQMLTAMAPVYIIGGVLFVVVFIPLNYRLRLSSFRIMEETPTGAIRATAESFRLMKGNCMTLFKLDLSFWWYHLLRAVLTVALMAGGFLLSDSHYVLACVAYSGIMLALEYSCLTFVQTTYATFYDTVLEKSKRPEHPQIPQ